ncbi:MAG: putative permease, partial [Kiritimatiellia bacterium]
MLTLVAMNAARLGLLFVPGLLGAVTAATGLLGEARQAVRVLNVYVLYVAFPALIVAGLVDNAFELPTSVGFWLAVPLGQVVMVSLVAGLRWLPGLRDQGGTLALVGLFGNYAYLGLPLVIGLYGEHVRGVAALLVSLHVVISVSLGPALLARWSGTGSSAREVLLGVLRLPLFWAPMVGLALRFAPTPARDLASAIVEPLGASAAPVALYLLGVYLFAERGVMGWPGLSVWLHMSLR